MRKLVLIFVVLVCVSCKEKRKSDLPQLITENKRYVISVNSKVMLRSEPQLLNTNFKGDTAVIKRRIGDKEARIRNFSSDTVLPKYQLKVFIDTTYDLYAKGFVYEKLKWPVLKPGDRQKYKSEGEIPSIKAYYDRMHVLNKKQVSAYPVLIFNQSKDMAYIENPLFFDIDIIQEALDSDGQWKPIEFQSSDVSGSCIPIYLNYQLLPKHYMAFGIIKYSGDFKTKIRAKLKSGNYIYYSNEITGYINRSQFDQSFIKKFLEERGKYDEKYFEADKKIMFLDVVDFTKLFSNEQQ